ncbi:MAG: HIT family protein [Arcobacteraceae bacterium]|nr:HIT family protein [Arcobacteraceae bacterium]
MIYQNQLIKVEIEPFEIPWLKIFTIDRIKEFSECSKKIQFEILEVLNIIEIEMLEYFKPTKVNIASFGNYVPHVHFHIQARFENDSFFPEPTWGKKQREAKLKLLDFDIFYLNIKLKLEKRSLSNG